MSFCFKNTSTDVVTFLRRRTDGRTDGRKILTGQNFSSSVEKDPALRAEKKKWGDLKKKKKYKNTKYPKTI